jgi:hypothetical protein
MSAALRLRKAENEILILRATIERLTKERDEVTGYAERLATALQDKHYRSDLPQWKPLSGDLIGILTQIDNMTAGLSRAALSPAKPQP